MPHYDYLIIGGGIAGVTAAETIRAHDRTGAIAIVSNEKHLLYSRVLLPSYIKGKIDRAKVFLRSADDFSRQNIDLWLEQEAVSLESAARRVALAGGTEIEFGKLLIATGGSVRPWQNLDWPYRLQTLDDADRIRRDLERITRPLVVGGSFIALEFLEIFLSHSIAPTLLLKDPYFFAALLDPQGGRLMEENFGEKGVTVIANDSAAEIVQIKPPPSPPPSADQNAEPFLPLAITTEGARQIRADAIAVGIGIDRARDFLKNSGIAFGEKGIRVNEFFETGEEGIFAAGDAAEFYDVVRGAYHTDGNWTSAFLQGEHAGMAMAGKKAPYKNVSAYSVANLGLQITALGDVRAADAHAVVRMDVEKKQYERFFIRGGALAGAVLINRFQDKAHLARLIGRKTPVEKYEDDLKDMGFDVKTIAVEADV